MGPELVVREGSPADLEPCLALARIAGRAPEAWFFTNGRNSASIELHRRFGFEEISRTFSFPGLTFDGGEGILYRARLRLE